MLQAKDNANFFVDYQDGQYAGDGTMIAIGISELDNLQVAMPSRTS